MEKQRWEESESSRKEVRRSEKRKSQKKQDAGAQKGRKVTVHCICHWFVTPEGRRVGSLKRRVRSLVRWEMKSCTPQWRKAHLQVKKLTALHIRSTFGNWDVDKVRAAVARSTCPSQNVQSTSCSVGALLEVDISKKRTPLWREDARSIFPSQNVQNTKCSDHFWKLRCRKSARRCGAKHVSKSRCYKHHIFGALCGVQMSFCVAGARDSAPCQKWEKCEGFVAVLSTTTPPLHHYTTPHHTTLHSIPHHSTALHYTALHFHNTTLHDATLRYSTLHKLHIIYYN